MNVVRTLFEWFEVFILFYFAILALVYTVTGYIGLRAIVIYARGLSTMALKDLQEHDFYKPISVLIPAYNEERTIVSSVNAMLAMEYPEFEVIVAVDGATDRTLERLAESFSLLEIPSAYRRVVPTEPVRAVYRSLRRPNLTVVDKENGGKADATNAAINVARYPIVCVIDADCLLDSDALARATRIFGEDETVVAVGGSIRPLNGTVVQDDTVVDVRAPATWVERFQVLEYARAFFTYRAAWSSANCLMIISGGFGLFRREVVLEVGGWKKGYVADDMEIVVRLHRHFREMKAPYRIVYTPDPICWTEVPPTFKALRKQRDGWQRGLLEVLWHHRVMLFNPRYGRVGMLGIPFLWIFEAAAAEVEALGYLLIVVTAILGILNVAFAVLFLALAILYSVLLSELALGIEALLLRRYSRFGDRFVLLLSAFVEFAGFREVITFVRSTAVFRVRRHHGRYWTTERTELMTPEGDGTPAGATPGTGAG